VVATRPSGTPHEQPQLPYATAAAFRTALKDRFTAIAKDDRRYTVDELQRQFAYDRVLARLFTSPDADMWVLKGAGALLARLEHARHSKDIDVYFAVRAAEAAAGWQTTSPTSSAPSSPLTRAKGWLEAAAAPRTLSTSR
jgi:hypothetical protein